MIKFSNKFAKTNRKLMYLDQTYIAPINIFKFDQPGIEFFLEHFKFLQYVNPENTEIMLDTDQFDINRRIPTTIKHVIVSMFSESPRLEALVHLATLNPDVSFLWLTDIDLYDYTIPENILHIKYKQWHWYLLAFKEFYPLDKLTWAKTKKIKYKFSSLNFKQRQSRALITAILQTHCKNDSIVSWHGIEKEDQLHKNLIDSLKDIDEFATLDWSILDKQIILENFNWAKNTRFQNIQDIENPAYANSLINFSNETDTYGYFNDGTVSYIRPGPFLTEKTWKCLVSGTILFSVSQPYVYDYLEKDYFLPINYSFNTNFDNDPGDITRLIKIYNEICMLNKLSYEEVAEENLDQCQLIQETILSPEYMEKILNQNKKQDKVILDWLNY